MLNILKQNIYIFNIFVYVTKITPLNIQEMSKMMGYIMPRRQKRDVHNHIGGRRGVSKMLMFVAMGESHEASGDLYEFIAIQRSSLY